MIAATETNRHKGFAIHISVLPVPVTLSFVAPGPPVNRWIHRRQLRRQWQGPGFAANPGADRYNAIME
jgi:hypothetical protein